MMAIVDVPTFAAQTRRAESRLTAMLPGARSNFVRAAVQADRGEITVGSAVKGGNPAALRRSRTGPGRLL